MAHTVTVGRLTFTSPSSLGFSGGSSEPNNRVDISGTLAVSDLDDAKSYRDELISMSKMDVPVAFTYTGDSTFKGYCKVVDVTVDILSLIHI